MGIQDWSENVIMVNLAAEPQLSEELQTVSSIVRKRKNCDVVVDFTDVDMVSSSSLAQLLRIQKTISDNGRQMTLCGLSKKTMGIFNLTGLDAVFNFADEVFTALAGLQMVS